MRRMSFGREFDSAVRAVMEREALQAEAQRRDDALRTGLVIVVRPLLGAETEGELGAELSASGVTAVRVEIENRTTRPYVFDRGDLRLVAEGGQRRRALALDDAGATLDPEANRKLAAKQVAEGTIAPGAKLSGFLYFPAAAYRRATVTLTDEESGEAEGFRVEF
jgi:hypothetical protein